MMTGRRRSNEKHRPEEEATAAAAATRIPASPMRRVFAAAPPIVKYKKAPQAPKRFKKIRSELEQQAGDHEQRQTKINTTEVAKMVSKAWKEMPDDEREKWEDIARLDKERYEREKLVYTGPWKVPILPKQTKKRAAALLRRQKHQHDPEEPRLPQPQPPLSAFLMFAQTKRAALPRHDHNEDDEDEDQDEGGHDDEEEGHDLARLWQDCDPVEKNNYIDTEFVLREQYEHALRAWQKQQQQIQQQTPTNNPDYESVGSTTSSTTTQTSLYSTKMAEAIFEYRPTKRRSENARAAAAAARTQETGYSAATATYHGASSAARSAGTTTTTTTTTYPAEYYHPSTTTTMTMMHGYTHPAYREYNSRGGPAEYSHDGSSDGNPPFRGAEPHPEYQYSQQQHPYYSQYPHYSQYPASYPYGGGGGYGYGYARPPLPPTADVVSSSSSALPFQPLATAPAPAVLYHYPNNSQLHAGSEVDTQPPPSPVCSQQQHSSSHGDGSNP